ncbi:hypothetical protein BA895_21390 [Humibacillus sp. DSM 29435]|uniref:hypothetical protein n=1 Tax=Humibacillus sp. DSM 29435 TaxID=1869167 RepID=UPI000871BAF6|nr:hypothetical protein [Humibacillus sp. DSM 29435]OFE15772.1 hypothetical protein BA895_21390 [Humibacillus sp. DSM 29435]
MSDCGGSDAAGRRDDGPPRSVAAEAALLVELLSQRGSFAGPSGGSRSGSGSQPKTDAGSTAPPEGGVCTCGGAPPAACRVCPVCQLIAFVQRVNPDTIERIADFATFAATALRDVAAAQRTASSTERADRGTPASDASDDGGRNPDAGEPGPAAGDRP